MVQTITSSTDPSVTRFFFIRHGQTDHNIKKIFQGHLDIPLNDEGHQQAKRLGVAIKGLTVDKIYSSDLTRCKQTLQAILDQRDGTDEIQYTDKLRERHMGVVQGMHLDDAIAYGEKMGKHYRDFGEDSSAFEERLREQIRLLEKEAKEKQHKNVMVMIHGGTIRCILKLLGMKEAGIVYNTSVTVADYNRDTGVWDIKVVGDTEHLGQQMNVADQRVR